MKYCYNRNNIDNLDNVLKITEFKKSWNGITFDEFQKIINRINNLDYKNNNILIELRNVIKIHPHQLLEWFDTKLIKEDIYTNTLIPLLRNIYFDNTNTDDTIDNTLINQISIHIRRGDLSSRLINHGIDYNYYKNKIENIVKVMPNIPIIIYCENINYEDLIPLKNINNVKLKLGGIDDLSNDFNELVRSKYLFISPCSMCVIAGYLNNNYVFYDNNSLESFRSAFINLTLSYCFINYNSLNLQNKLLKTVSK